MQGVADWVTLQGVADLVPHYTTQWGSRVGKVGAAGPVLCCQCCVASVVATAVLPVLGN